MLTPALYSCLTLGELLNLPDPNLLHSKPGTGPQWGQMNRKHLTLERISLVKFFLSMFINYLDSILKNRDITLPINVHLIKVMVFPVIMYGCESWTRKKAEHRRIDAFDLCCWRRLLRVVWIARRSNQSILKEISPECSLKGLMLKLKLQYFGHLMQ